MSGIIEAYEYLRWTRRYFQCGSFELKAIANDNNLALLQVGSILWKNDDEEAGIIEFLELTMQEQEYITVSKRWGVSITARITEIEESYDRTGMSIAVTFGKPLLSLTQKLKEGGF